MVLYLKKNKTSIFKNVKILPIIKTIDDINYLKKSGIIF